MSHATPEDCPCCYSHLDDDDGKDSALVSAFLAGMVAHEESVPILEALCRRHSVIAAEAVAFVNANGGRAPS